MSRRKKHIVRLAAIVTFIVLGAIFYASTMSEVFWNNATGRLATSLKKSFNISYQPLSTTVEVTRNDTRKKLILLYTKFFKGPWYLRWNQNFPCSFKSRCTFTYNRDLIYEADAVGFHDADLPDITLPTRTKIQQIWFYFNLESPEFTKTTGRYDGVFNWTMSYRADSDVFSPYGSFRPLGCNEIQHDWSSTSNTNKKSKLIAWLVSSCESPSGRSEFARKLAEYVPIDIYGKCGNLTCSKGRKLRLSNKCKATLRDYKFYLAFENTNCHDYITEKYWEHGLENGLVPIVLGGANYAKLAIPGSYVNVHDFKTVKALAEYIKYLDRNNTAYNEYFAWRRSYKLDTPYLYGCRLCKALHSTTAKIRKVYKDFDAFWRTGKCRGKIIYH